VTNALAPILSAKMPAASIMAERNMRVEVFFRRRAFFKPSGTSVKGSIQRRV
jgi:hypothetical protein